VESYLIFRLLAKYNPAAAAYAERLDRAKESGKKLATNYLSRDNAQRLLSVIKGVIVQQVVDCIRVQKKCSIISDGTYDSSKQEATVLLLRYIEIGENDILIPVERVVDVFCCGDTSGVSLCNKIQELLKMIDVDIQWVVGQGYDGAGNVRGKYKGLKTNIQEINPKAIYIWCHGHRFNLVIESTVTCCSEIKNAIGLLDELYVFFSGHKRNSIFVDAQSDSGQKRQLKRVVSTRWNSRQAAVYTTITCFRAVLSSLDILSSTGGLVEYPDINFIICIFSFSLSLPHPLSPHPRVLSPSILISLLFVYCYFSCVALII